MFLCRAGEIGQLVGSVFLWPAWYLLICGSTSIKRIELHDCPARYLKNCDSEENSTAVSVHLMNEVCLHIFIDFISILLFNSFVHYHSPCFATTISWSSGWLLTIPCATIINPVATTVSSLRIVTFTSTVRCEVRSDFYETNYTQKFSQIVTFVLYTCLQIQLYQE
jgi:hypothetical protein